VLLNPHVLTNILVDFLLLILGLYPFLISLEVVRKWQRNSHNEKQFALQKKLYLGATVAKYIFIVKIPLFFFFIYTLNSLAELVKGAMCAVGVVEASSYGIYVTALKVLDVYLFGAWIVLSDRNFSFKTLPYTKLAALFYLFLYPLLALEVFLEFFYFYSMNPDILVACCSVVFKEGSQTFFTTLISLPNIYQQIIFYLFYVMLVVAFLKNFYYLYTILSSLFIPVALVTLIGYFGTYIYELPTHHCPFCMLQSDYGYIGYLLYALLYVGTFFGIVWGFVKKERMGKISIVALTTYSVIVSFYPIVYYLKQGVWLY
jgi:hypothetical protein